MRRLWTWLKSLSPFPIFVYDDRADWEDWEYPSQIIRQHGTPTSERTEE